MRAQRALLHAGSAPDHGREGPSRQAALAGTDVATAGGGGGVS